MRIGLSMSAAAVLSICLSNALAANAQSTGDKQAPVTNSERLPMSHARKPKLSLENALAIAKSQLKNPSEISSYWLYGAHFILYGDSTLPDKDKAPCWHFTWLSDDFGQAAIEVVVFMDGNSMRLSTL